MPAGRFLERRLTPALPVACCVALRPRARLLHATLNLPSGRTARRPRASYILPDHDRHGDGILVDVATSGRINKPAPRSKQRAPRARVARRAPHPHSPRLPRLYFLTPRQHARVATPAHHALQATSPARGGRTSPLGWDLNAARGRLLRHVSPLFAGHLAAPPPRATARIINPALLARTARTGDTLPKVQPNLPARTICSLEGRTTFSCSNAFVGRQEGKLSWFPRHPTPGKPHPTPTFWLA